ncbi:hypothetical protein HDA40_000689 [Hamadaea flava]|uniref:Sulfurtransferase TusA family protein n=1 Tax=Hamadaea flava TaxID=1742688 RepID=A0ABV8M0D7_9ACTN|nr:hypothetical protein [Hamadaea flava]MCP2322182.1 hypothetical protein [Hamadaea flava]
MPANPPPATVVIDAGGEPWSRIIPLLDGWVDRLPDGGLIELVGEDPHLPDALAGWCAEHGFPMHRLAARAGHRIELPPAGTTATAADRPPHPDL